MKNLNKNSVFNKGFIGGDTYSNKTHSEIYTTWADMLRRAYSEKFHSIQPTYKDVIVCEEWHNFQNFAKWFEENYNPETMQDWHLDKDILIKGNKIYSPETCCFTPKEINLLFTKTNSMRGASPIGVKIKNSGRFESRMSKNNKYKYIGTFNTPEEAFQAYKTEKEEYIKEVADKWKDLIDPRVHEAMYNYEVEITD